MFNSRDLRCCIFVALGVFMGISIAGASDAPKKRRGAGPLQILPKESLFCVQINSLKQTGDAINAFLLDVAPEDWNAKEELLSGLGKILGDGKPKAIRTNAAFTFFGVNLPSQEQNANPFGNLFIGTLVPVRNYENFVAKNQNIGEPDEDGISTIMVGETKRGLVVQVRRFAVICGPNDREKLLRFKTTINRKGRKLFATLDEDEKELSRTAPIWAYANVQQVSKVFIPMVFDGLQQMKVVIKKAQESGEGPSIDPEAVIGFYSEILKVLLEGTDRVSIGITPSAEVCRFTMQSQAVEGTFLAQMFAAAPAGIDIGELLGYLDNGAFLNLVGKIDREGMKLAYLKMIDLFSKLAPEAVGEAEVENLKGLTKKSIDAMGDGIALSLKSGQGSAGPFSFKYVIKVRDEKAFEQVIDEQLKMMNDGLFNKLYRGFGLDMKINAKKDAAEYKGVKIGSARISFQMGKKDSQENKMLKAIWGEGMEYTWAVLDGYCVCAIGGDSDQTIRNLIDQVKAGGPQELASEIDRAVEIFNPDESQEYDFGGTCNVVRMLNLMSSFISASGGPKIEPLHMPTATNIVFAGWSADGKLTVETVLPKQHLLEVKAAAEEFSKRIRVATKK
jgi:hypothetical protein